MKVEVEIGDDGSVSEEHLTKLPDGLKAHLHALSDRTFKEGYQKGMAKKAAELTPHLVDPTERERLANIQAELEERKIKDAERDKQYEEAQRLRDERHAKQLEQTKQEIAKRDARLRQAIATEIKSEALKAGAREESLGELAVILGGEIDLNEALEPFVKGRDGQPAVDAKGQPLTIEGRVRAYLETNRHHLRANVGAGGGARGGASFAHLSGDAQDAAREIESIRERIASKGDRSDQSIEDLYQASRRLRKAHAGS